MISVSEALSCILELVEPMATERVPLQSASRRVLAQDVVATRAQPPWNTSAMDGYAVLNSGVAPGVEFKVAGEVPAGRAFNRAVGLGEAVRIFTGARVPAGANRVIIQEDVQRTGDVITLRSRIDAELYVRVSGGDFKEGACVEAPRLLTPALISLIASMNHGEITVYRRPVVAVVPTGDELAMPGSSSSSDSIIASNGFGIKILLEGYGAEVRMLPIAKDNLASLTSVLSLGLNSDLIVTVGGASVGEYDLVQKAAVGLGMETLFNSVAVRPGKPLIAGRLQGVPLVGLPGNPVSSIVCGHVFLVPVIRAMQNLGRGSLPLKEATLATAIEQNGTRQHYMRAFSEYTGRKRHLHVFKRQDSSLVSVLAKADALVVRPPNDPPREKGELVDYICLKTA